MKTIFPTLALLLFTLPAGQTARADSRYRAEVAFPHLKFESPLFITEAPRAEGGARRLCVVEQDGFVRCFDHQREAKGTILALDISKKVRRAHNEEGLLGLAFHPAALKNGKVYLYYSANNPRRNVLSEFTIKQGSLKIDRASEKVLLDIEKPYGNHNGGMLAFGPDGYLYIAVGDGGGAGDPHDNGQNLSVLLGKILRIDVDNRDKSLPGLLYGIPAGNPFIKTPGARSEIFAYGLRNVWRFSFDRDQGTLWAADVGQNKWEEVDIVTKGGNYGWNHREGMHPFTDVALAQPMIDPIFEYGRDEGQSVTGGYVYRGKKLPELAGAYIYGDFLSGHIWALAYDGQQAGKNTLIAEGEMISSFGEDAAGEIYFTSFNGKIYTLEK